MPNWKLSGSVKDEIQNQANALAARRVQHMMADFPMSVAEVQRAIMPDSHLEALRSLEDGGILSLPKAQGLPIVFFRDDFLALTRGAGVLVTLPSEVFIPRTVYHNWHAHYGKKLELKSTREALMFDRLDPEQKSRLATWVNRSVKERRLEQIAALTVRRVLKNCMTSGELLATWPLLGTLVTDAVWRGRLRAPPRKLSNYAPRTYVIEPLLRRMQATEVILTGAEMMAEYVPTPGVVHADLAVWEHLPNDPKFDGEV